MAISIKIRFITVLITATSLMLGFACVRVRFKLLKSLSEKIHVWHWVTGLNMA
ncbi:hypothetical protein EMIT0P395_60002 [Pseudomonas sp. IT-P395]